MRASWVTGFLALGFVACGGQTTIDGSTTCATFHAVVQQRSIDKLDLLLVIDNSPAMSDAQVLLARAVPSLVDRLINPPCVAQDGTPGKTPASPDTACDPGFARKYQPVADLHVGVVSTSLGGHGATLCSPASATWSPAQDDAGHLVGKARSGISTYQGEGFLAWDPSSDAAKLDQDVANMVFANGEAGCPLSAPLEAWYRFLVDPDPPASVTKGDPGKTVTSGTDGELLAERAAFLRPDSLVDIVMISDKDDCSVADTGLGWLVGYDASPLPNATSVCATNPNDKCCHSCGLTDPAGCPHDPICDTQPNLPAAADPMSLRCWDQKRRFGLATDPTHPEAGLLYPTGRYSNAIKNATLCPAHLDLACKSGESGVTNPLYADGRAPDQVYLAGVVGVPWQDIATDETRDAPDRLSYLTATDLDGAGRWHDIVGDPAKLEPPGDPLMTETTEVRTGKNPFTNAALAPPGAGPTANPINGHERAIANQDDLQYACIFPLDQPKDCSNGGNACDCGPGHASDNPLCQAPTTGSASSTTQYYGKAYPGIRELEVLREVGDNAVPGSLCPKIADPANPDFAFNPVLAPITDRLSTGFAGRCLPQAVDVDPTTTQVACSVVEAIGGAPAAGLDCNRPGRAAITDASLRSDTLAQLKSKGVCDAAGQPACASLLLCAVRQLDASTNPDAMSACENQTQAAAGASGFCYIANNASGQHVGNPDLTSKCPESQRQLLRLVGNDPHAPLPMSDASYVYACYRPGC